MLPCQPTHEILKTQSHPNQFVHKTIDCIHQRGPIGTGVASRLLCHQGIDRRSQTSTPCTMNCSHSRRGLRPRDVGQREATQTMWSSSAETPPLSALFTLIDVYLGRNPYTTQRPILCENATSSTKPKVHNILHCRQKWIEPRPQTTRRLQ